MPLDGKSRKHQTQKVVIPKGTINPEETTIIEIPAILQEQPIVIAKKIVSNTYINHDDGRPASKHNRTRVKVPHTSSSVYHSFQSSPAERTTFHSVQQQPSQFDLNQTEENEKRMLQQDLEDFQQARRKLLNDTSTLAAKSNYSNFAPDDTQQPAFKSSTFVNCPYKNPNTSSNISTSDFERSLVVTPNYKGFNKNNVSTSTALEKTSFYDLDCECSESATKSYKSLKFPANKSSKGYMRSNSPGGRL